MKSLCMSLSKHLTSCVSWCTAEIVQYVAVWYRANAHVPYVNYTTCAVTIVCTEVYRLSLCMLLSKHACGCQQDARQSIHISCMKFYGSGLSPSIPPTNIDTSQSASISSHSSYNILWTPSHLIALDYIITLMYECSRDTCIDINH